MKKEKLFVLLLLSIFLAGCKEKEAKEGELIYQIYYLQTEEQNPLIAILPKKINIKFKNNNTHANIDGFFGTFNLKLITNRKTGKNYTALRILDKKFMTITPIDSISPAYEEISIAKIIEKPQDTATFAGLVSYQVEIILGQMADSTIKFYITKNIKIEDPNVNSPFYQIKGVLTKFQAKVAGIDMVFELKQFIKKNIDDSEFLPPKDYKVIGAKELREIIKSFQQ